MTNEQLRVLLELYRTMLRAEIENLHRELENCGGSHERLPSPFRSYPVEERPTGLFKALNGLRVLSQLMSNATEDLTSSKGRRL